MNNPVDYFNSMARETGRTLDEMSKTEDLEQRRVQSEIIRNLCHSMEVFIDYMASALDDDDIFEYPTEELE